MAEMGRYCKAYHVRHLREFSAWQPNLANLRPDTNLVDGEDVTTVRTALTDDDVLFVQESLTVTDGIFLDEHIVFDAVTPEWQAFCRDTLAFEVPNDELPPPPTPVAAGSEA